MRWLQPFTGGAIMLHRQLEACAIETIGKVVRGCQVNGRRAHEGRGGAAGPASDRGFAAVTSAFARAAEA